MTVDEWTTNDAQSLTHDHPPGARAPWDRWPIGAPDGREVGTLVAHFEHDSNGHPGVVVIDRADPRITISLDFLMHTWPRSWWWWWDPDDGAGWTVGRTLVTFRGVNREVVYRVADRDDSRYLYLLEWPD